MSVRNISWVAIPILFALGLAAAAPAAAARDRTPPSTPKNLRITAATSSSVSLAWDASQDNSGSFSYIVLETSSWTSSTVSQSQTMFTRTRLWPELTHAWVVYAVDPAGNRSASSNTVRYTTPPDTTSPTAPTLATTFVGPTRAVLDWTDSVDDVSNVIYAVEVNGNPIQVAYESAATVPDLAPSTTYVFRVAARDKWGNTARSNAVSVTTPAADTSAAPSPPGNLRAGSESSGCEAWLSWDASTDDADPPSAIRYDVYVNGEVVPESTTFGYTSTIAYARVQGTNTFFIVAVDSAGNASAPSNELTFPEMSPC